jgi:polygalacturonase
VPVFHAKDLPANTPVAEQTAALQGAIDACAANGGVLVVPAGTRMTLGTIHLRSRLCLHLEPGSLLQASGDPGDFESRGSWGGWNWKYWFLADDCDELSVTGTGTLDGNGVSYMAYERADGFVPKGGTDHLNVRPLLMGLFGCHKVRIEDVTFRDSAHWTLRTVGCKDVGIRGISILNDLRIPNNDGIDIDHCRDVRVSDSHIVAGDDAISLKTVAEYAEYGAMENVVVSGCTLRSRSSALVVGCEVYSDIRNVLFSNCVIDRSNRGLSIAHRQQGNIENVLFSNMVVNTESQGEMWWGKAEPISVTSLLAPYPWHDEGRLGYVRNVRFRDIVCSSENGVVIQGGEAARLSEITLDGVRLTLMQGSQPRPSRHDFRPYLERDLPGFGDGQERAAGRRKGTGARAVGPDDRFEGSTLERGLHGYYIEKANDVTLRACSVRVADQALPALRSPLTVSRVENLEVEGFRPPEQWTGGRTDPRKSGR